MLLLNVDLRPGGSSNISESVKFICCFEGTLCSLGKNFVFKFVALRQQHAIQESNHGILQNFGDFLTHNSDEYNKGLQKEAFNLWKCAAMHIRFLISHDVSEESNLYDSESWIMMKSLQHR